MIGKLQSLVDENKVNLTVGSIDTRIKNGKRASYNSVFQFNSGQENYGLYDKQRLVPVIEKRIFEGIFDFINNLPGMAGFELGENSIAFDSKNNFLPNEL